jgi:stage II sporulation protein D
LTRLFILALTALALTAASATSAHAAASKFTISGAGFGHGIGMSQYGAYGMAQQGWNHARILGHYYTGTALGQVDPAQTVRVLLQSAQQSSFTGATAAGGRTLNPAARYSVRRAAGNFVDLIGPKGKRMKRVAAPLVASGPGPVTLLGRAGNGRVDSPYRGVLEFHPDPLGGVYAVNALALDEYVQGVVPDESPPSWPIEALKAQAVAARTYAITTSKGGAGYDHYPDTRSQVYGGVAAEEPSTNLAVQQTAGGVVTYEGVPVTTYFFSTSGGRTENVENAWPGSSPKPWLKSVEDPFDAVSPRHRWSPTSMNLRAAGAKLRGLVKGRFLGVQVVQRGYSPRVVYADVVGTRGRTRVTGPTLRARFGTYDTWMYFTSMTTKPVPEPQPAAPGEPAPGSGGAVAPELRAVRGRAEANLAGYAFGLKRGARLRVQQRFDRRWLTVTRTRVQADSRYSAPVFDKGVYRVVADGLIGPLVRVR